MIRPSAKSVRLFIALCLMLSNTPLALPQGQTNGAIQGRAYEVGTDAPVAGVVITVRNQDNGLERTTITGSDGTYVITTLPPGLYYMTATSKDYVSDPIENFPVRLGKTNQVQPPPFAMRKVNAPVQNLPVQPDPSKPGKQNSGQTSQTEGNDVEQLTNTANATRSNNFDSRQIVGLPLPGTRTFDDLAFLASGVAPPPQPIGTILGPGVGAGVGTSGQFSVNGLRARSNNFTIDGSDNNDPDIGVRRQGFVALVPQSPETVQEFQISTLLWDAEFGRNPGSQVNAVSKGGRNEYHGQVYGFFTDSHLNARNAFDFLGGPSDGENPYTRVQVGFVAGGPIVRDRAQFFIGLERQVINSSVEQQFAVPTIDQRRFRRRDFALAEFTGPDNQGFPTFRFLQSELGLTPRGVTAFSVYPAPNNPGGLYGDNTLTKILPADGDGTVLSAKLTEKVTQNNSLSLRYNITDDSRTLPSINRAIDSTINSDTRTQDLSFIFDSSFTPVISNQGRFSFGRTRLKFPEFSASPFIFNKVATSEFTLIGSEVSRVTRTLETGRVGQVTIEPFSPVGVDSYTFPQNRTNNTFQFADTLSWTPRKHTVKVGADIRYLQLDSSQERLFRPSIVFGSGLATRGVIDFDVAEPPFFDFKFNRSDVSVIEGAQLAAVGLVSSVYQTITSGAPNPTVNLRSTEYNFFINDNWRVSRNFTLDYGIRYEYNSRPRDKRIESAITLQNIPAASRSEFRALFPGVPVNAVDQTFDLFVDTFNKGLLAYSQILAGRTQIFKRDQNNFGPHIGFAWDPKSDGKMSIRGGYGIYYDTILGAFVSQSRNIFPNEIPISLDPAFGGFNFETFPNPSLLKFAGTVDLIKPNTLNQFGGSPGLFVPLIGALFFQNSLAGGLAFTLPEANLHTPYAQHWHLTIERALLGDYLVSAGYVGTKGTKLTRLTTPNGGPNVSALVTIIDRAKGGGVTTPLELPVIFPNPAIIRQSTESIRKFFGVQGRPIPELGPYQLFENSANSIYNALQLEMRKRYAHGYTFTASYTWSHALDDVSDVFPIAGAPVLPQDSRNLRLERADANYDIRHKFSASLIWDLPFYRGSTTAAARWLGGWQVASIFLAHSGQPFTLNLSVDANLDGNLTDRPSTTNGLVFFDGHSSRRVSAGNHEVTDFLDLGRNGNVARNSVRADGFINWDLAFNKTFRFTESQSLELRTEFFNLLNRVNFGIPIRVIGAPGFGSSVDTANPARTIQFALKYSF
jgi:hypothetical protein